MNNHSLLQKSIAKYTYAHSAYLLNLHGYSRFAYFLLIIFTILPLLSRSQIRGSEINVMISPDHRDWNYKTGEEARFRISVLKSGTPLPGVRIDLEGGPEMYPTEQKSNVYLSDGTLQYAGRLSHPGFYRLKVTAHVNGRDYSGLCTVGFSPEKIRPATQLPADFDEFWQTALSDARQNKLNPRLRLLPDRCTDAVNVYELSFVNDRPDSRIFGILSVPVQPGRYPALLRVPGAGVRPYEGDTYTAPGKVIVLEIGIHGIPVTMDRRVYDCLGASALYNYGGGAPSDPNRNYYKRVITGAVRAVDYLCSLPQWDRNTVGVTGASQGGFLSLAVAALDPRITFLAAVHDAMCDYESELNNVAGGWPHHFYRGPQPHQETINALRYYDGVNFARRCRVPAWFSFGYNDEVVPPTSSYGVYNIYPASKQLSVYPMTGHYWHQEQWDEWQAWLTKMLGIK